MPTRKPIVLHTSRDQQILQALTMTPMTLHQLLKFSSSFNQPFPNRRILHKRLLKLAAAKRIYCWKYATTDRRTVNYYTPTKIGYRLVFGADAPPPPKSVTGPIALSLQPHTKAHADVLVHIAVACFKAKVRLESFYREHALRIPVGDDMLCPDSSFQLVSKIRKAYSYFVELDNATETVHSDTIADSLKRKLTLYTTLAGHANTYFRVLIFTTASTKRLDHILALAASLSPNPQRSLVYGITVEDFLAHDETLTTKCFRNHRGEPVSLIDDAEANNSQSGRPSLRNDKQKVLRS